MGEIRFYHLTERPLEAVLPVMLERCLERGWRAVVRGTDADRLAWLDDHLWTWRDESFLPHGAAGRTGGDGSDQPIWLTTGPERPNEPQSVFLVDGAEEAPAALSGLEAAAILFDGHDAAAVEQARGQWRAVTGAGLKAVYWAQQGGAWIRRAESG